MAGGSFSLLINLSCWNGTFTDNKNYRIVSVHVRQIWANQQLCCEWCTRSDAQLDSKVSVLLPKASLAKTNEV